MPLAGCFVDESGHAHKGPVGSLIPVWLWECFCCSVMSLRAFLWMLACGTLSLLLPLGWYVAAYQQGGEEFLALVMEENFGRMTNTMSYESCVNPWYYNLITLLCGRLCPLDTVACVFTFHIAVA